MHAHRFAFAVLLVICGFAAGLVVLGRMRTAGEADAQVQSTPRPPASAPAAPAPAAAPVVNASLPDFSRIAERTVPAVVNVSSRQVVRRSNSPFANDPLFGLFGVIALAGHLQEKFQLPYQFFDFPTGL